MILNARMLMAPPKKQKAFVHRDERPSRGTTRLHRPLARPASSSPQRERLKTPARSRRPSGSAYLGLLRFDLRLRGLFRRCPGPSFSAARGSLLSQRPRTRPHRRLYVCTCWRERYPPAPSMSSHRSRSRDLLDVIDDQVGNRKAGRGHEAVELRCVVELVDEQSPIVLQQVHREEAATDRRRSLAAALIDFRRH